MSHVLITGGSRGIGEALVRYFAAKGWQVAFTYVKSKEKAEALAKECNALAICADNIDETAVKEAVALATSTYSAPDVLINNAAVSSFQLFQDVSTELWETTVNTNLRGAFFYTRECLPEMISRQSGVILNISSIWGITGASCEVLYSTTKAALIGMTKALAKEVAPSGIRVNCIAPGVIDTEMNRHLTEEDRTALLEGIPLGRMGVGEDIARLAYYLAAEDSYITGQIISPNGGMII